MQVTPVKSKVQRRREKIRAIIVFGIILIAAAVYWINEEGERERKAQLSDSALVFENNPQAWLSSPKDVSDFLKDVQSDQVSVAGISRSWVLYTKKDGAKFSTRVVCASYLTCEGLGSLNDLSVKHHFTLVAIDVDTRTTVSRVFDVLGSVLSVLIQVAMLAAMVFLARMSGLGAKQDKVNLAEHPNTRFSDVVGASEAKASFRQVQAFLENPQKYLAVGAKPPRGVLLDGPPGTGKTLLARALAGECGVNFISVDGSYFTSMYYGLGVAKAKKLFKMARDHAPCILFIDEIDGIGRRVSHNDMRGAEQEGNRIINRILVEMDGFSPLEDVVVIGATNHADNVEPALRRSGRFDLVVHVNMPNVEERKALFDLYLKKVASDPSIDTEGLARVATSMSPSDIENLVNKAASHAAELGDNQVREEHLFQALETHQLGGAVSSIKGLITDKTRQRIAVHEAGHALVAHFLKAGSVDRISIEPRGRSLGATYVSRPTEEPLYGETELQSRLAMMLGGREAELLVLGNTSSGAAEDLEQATTTATSMVGTYGFSKAFGLLSVRGVPKELLGPDTQRELLYEARSLLEQAQSTAVAVLGAHRDRLDALVELLLERETVSGTVLRNVLGEAPAAPFQRRLQAEQQERESCLA